MKFYYNLALVMTKMANKYGETLEDLGIDWREAEILRVHIEKNSLGDYLVVEIDEEGD